MPLELDSVNHKFPSGPAVMLFGPLLAMGIGNEVKMWVAASSSTMLFALVSTNHRLPSGPTVILAAPLLAVGIV